MDVKELQKRKKTLQTAISGSVAALVEDFKKDTGMSPSRVSIDMIFISDIGYQPVVIDEATYIPLDLFYSPDISRKGAIEEELKMVGGFIQQIKELNTPFLGPASMVMVCLVPEKKAVEFASKDFMSK